MPAESQAIINKDSRGSSTEVSQSSAVGSIANQTPTRAGALQYSLHEWNHVRPRLTLGVPQGTVLGPLMFLLLINDMQDDLECTLRLFADDALLYHKITHHDVTLAFQPDVDKLGLWADRWQMLFNHYKCHKNVCFP